MISSNRHILSHSAALTPRQRHSISLVLRARSIEEGCRTARITRQTWYRWMKDEGFAEELNLQREAIITESLNRLKGAVTSAVDGLTALVDAGEGTVRLRACSHVLDYFMKAREMEDMERRLLALERAVREDPTP